MTKNIIWFWMGLMAASPSDVTAAGQDRFNYYGTVQRSDGFYDYGPQDWPKLDCNVSDIESCVSSFWKEVWIVFWIFTIFY